MSKVRNAGSSSGKGKKFGKALGSGVAQDKIVKLVAASISKTVMGLWSSL